MQINRTRDAKSLISLVPMIDVMLILLVFFMVTSTYLNLDIIAMVDSADAPQGKANSVDTTPLLIRIDENGQPRVQGHPQETEVLDALIRDRLSRDPLTSILILPSGAATTQHLVNVMDTATRAGATRLRLIRLEVRQ